MPRTWPGRRAAREISASRLTCLRLCYESWLTISCVLDTDLDTVSGSPTVVWCGVAEGCANDSAVRALPNSLPGRSRLNGTEQLVAPSPERALLFQPRVALRFAGAMAFFAATVWIAALNQHAPLDIKAGIPARALAALVPVLAGASGRARGLEAVARFRRGHSADARSSTSRRFRGSSAGFRSSSRPSSWPRSGLG